MRVCLYMRLPQAWAAGWRAADIYACVLPGDFFWRREQQGWGWQHWCPHCCQVVVCPQLCGSPPAVSGWGRGVCSLATGQGPAARGWHLLGACRAPLCCLWGWVCWTQHEHRLPLSRLHNVVTQRGVFVTQLMCGATTQLSATQLSALSSEVHPLYALKALQVGSRIFKAGHKGHTSPDVMLSGWFFLFVYNSLPLCQRIRAGRCAVRWSPAGMCR